MIMNIEKTSGSDPDQPIRRLGPADPARYRIVVKGCLDASWSEWFDNLAVVADTTRSETAISGRLADQAALHGLLNKISNLGLVLLCVTVLFPESSGSAVHG